MEEMISIPVPEYERMKQQIASLQEELSLLKNGRSSFASSTSLS
jgi:hypothetical protein